MNIRDKIKLLKKQNYHKHSSYSNPSTTDSAVLSETYAKRAKELGDGILSSVEHGFQGNYWETYLLAKEYGLKFIFGAEAYWVKDRFEKDRTNSHIIILAKNEKGRKAINLALSEANDTGYFYKPRLDLELLLSLPPKDVFITTACLAFWQYDDIDDIVLKLHSHFKENMMLEVQYHNTKIQKDINSHILELSKEHNIKIIMGCDSHFIYPEQAEEREYLLTFKGMKYDNEEEWDMDYPTTIEAYERFKKQGILNDDEIYEAINNTNIILSFEDIEFDKNIKLISLLPNHTQEEKNTYYKNLILKEFKNYVAENEIPKDEWKRYQEGIKTEVKTVIDTGMADYFIFDYHAVQDAVANGGMITPTGRGCFTEDALVHTDKTIKSIKDVVIGDRVITRDGKFEEVYDTMSYDIEENLVQIKHLYGTDKYFPTICTLDHKILINRNNTIEWIQAKDIEIGDYVCTPKIKTENIKNIVIDMNKYNVFNYEFDDEYIYEVKKTTGQYYPYNPSEVAEKIGVGKSTVEQFADINCKKNLFSYKKDKLKELMDYIPFNSREEYCKYVKDIKTQKIPRYIEIDKTFNQFIGLMYGDGFTNDKEKNGFPLAIGLAINSTTGKNEKNREIFYEIANKINLNVYENNSKNKNLSQLYLNSKVFSNFIKEELFYSEFSKEKQFNPLWFNQNKENLSGLIDGLLLSDGHINERINFDNTSKPILNAYKILCLACGVGVNSISYRPSRIDSRGFNCKGAFKLRINPNYKNANKKKERILEDEDFYYLPIKEIKTLQKTKTKVYDISVRNNPSYLINNMIVHNSGVSYFTNTLLGFSNVDRFISPVTLYPERFMSVSRISDAISLPDLDLNQGNVEVFVEAQKKLLGEGHIYPMIAYGTLKAKSAWKMYAGANNVDFEISNTISSQIDKYEEALKYAEDDERDDIKLSDFIDKKYHDLLKASSSYLGIISDKKKHACGYLLYDKDIREEIGLIKCKSENSKKEYLVALIDGKMADEFKFLKNDNLKVDVVKSNYLIAERAGIKLPTIRQLTKLVEGDEKVWKLYSDGWTLGLNQVEKDTTTKKVMAYKPTTIAELCCFIAAIRPSFKSMYKIFASRQPFNYGIPSFDNIIQNEHIKDSFIFFQEQIMSALAFGGIAIGDTYTLLRAISKKRHKIINQFKDDFLHGFKEKVMELENKTKEEALTIAHKVWTIIEDASAYGFNASHSLCVCYDSLYGAYYKAYHPYEFYEVMLNLYAEKGKNDKVALFKQEMYSYANIKEGMFKFRADNRRFTLDRDNQCIHPALKGIKGIGQNDAEEIYKLRDNKYNSFVDLYHDLKTKTGVNTGKIKSLILLDYFSEFGKRDKLLRIAKIYEDLYDRKQISKDKIEELGLTKNIVAKYSKKETAKLFKDMDMIGLISELTSSLEDKDISVLDIVQAEIDYYGYINYKNENIKNYYYVSKIDIYKNKTSATYYLNVYNIEKGINERVKVKDYEGFSMYPIKEKDFIKVTDSSLEPKKQQLEVKGKDGKMKKKWFNIPNEFWKILNEWYVVRKGEK